ncbi:MAG: phosphatidylglycerophosphatase A [Limnobacter sp.]|nr:phosphatidylglycerophosphatase A [Limnobacter sp.]
MNSSTSAIKPKRPTWTFALAHPAHFLAVGCGSGLAWVSPGTFGTLFGWLAFVAMDPFLSDLGWLVCIVVSFLMGVWICAKAGRALGVIDHGAIVWDEIVAIWLVLWVADAQLGDPIGQLIAVAVFRFFDIVKPPPIRWFDTRFKSGFGVMLDDLVAALMTLLALAVGLYFY